MDASSIIRTLTVANFKAEQHVTKLNVIKTPKTGTFLMVCGETNNTIGYVSTKVKSMADLKEPVVVEVSDDSAEGSHYVLCNKGAGEATTVFSL